MNKREHSVSPNLGAVKADLLARKRELEEELIGLNQQRFSDGQVQDVGDQALSSTMDSLIGSIQSNRRDEYRRIVDALKMIEEGRYGICIDCDQSISPKRLSSFPNATRCIRCQEIFEMSSSD